VTNDPGPIGGANIGAACAIFDERGRVLLVKHTYGRLNWELPGGLALPGEAPWTTAQRELAEETGLVLDVERLAGVYFEPGHDFGPMIHFVFRMSWTGADEPVARPPEIGNVGWFVVDEFPTPFSDFSELRIRDALASDVGYRRIDARKWRS